MLKLKYQRLLLLQRQEELQMQLEELELQDQQRKYKEVKRMLKEAAALELADIHVTVPRAEK